MKLLGPSLLLFCAYCISTARAAVIFYTVADGGVYSGGSTSPYYVSVANNIHGDVQFAHFNSAAYTNIVLELSAYGLPNFGPVNVYGFDNAAGSLNGGDFNAGTFLGSLSIPNAYGQPAYFDVTSFVHSTGGAYFGFDLRPTGTGGATLCSSMFNYGLPPELIATPIPEPSTIALVGLCGAFFGLLYAKQRQAVVPRELIISQLKTKN